jgi:hypothetical protein
MIEKTTAVTLSCVSELKLDFLTTSKLFVIIRCENQRRIFKETVISPLLLSKSISRNENELWFCVLASSLKSLSIHHSFHLKSRNPIIPENERNENPKR